MKNVFDRQKDRQEEDTQTDKHEDRRKGRLGKGCDMYPFKPFCYLATDF